MVQQTHTVALFVTCLVDLFRPTVGLAAVKLLEQAGCTVEVPAVQTCCGQPGYNSGDRADAIAIGRQVIDAFEAYEYVVAPSGSCAGMIRKHYPTLFAGEPALEARARALAARTFELVSFLHDVLGKTSVEATFAGAVTYHDSCSSLRELGIARQPRALLESIAGVSLKEMSGSEVCCGFGGAFSVKYPVISMDIVSRKAQAAAESGAEVVLGGDLGCLLNIAGRLKRQGAALHVRHVAEVLADMADSPAIGEGGSA